MQKIAATIDEPFFSPEQLSTIYNADDIGFDSKVFCFYIITALYYLKYLDVYFRRDFSIIRIDRLGYLGILFHRRGYYEKG